MRFAVVLIVVALATYLAGYLIDGFWSYLAMALVVLIGVVALGRMKSSRASNTRHR
ncbi:MULTISPECIES: hypothetical protein [Actinomycetes]|uniref:hypothetical protein n=1 Tax=Actinomycetes TaxID=1760 RepID=UPI00131A38E7|nr:MULTISPECIES: hypothetical protein [Actinomycetes]